MAICSPASQSELPAHVARGDATRQNSACVSGSKRSDTPVFPATPATGAAPRTWLGRLLHWMAESRSHRVICLVLGIWLLNSFDLMFTILSHEQGVLHEENPVARLMLGYGTTSVVLFKTGLVLIGSYPLLRFRRARITELGTYVILVAYALLALRWSTCYELYDFSLANGFYFSGTEALIAPGPH